MPSRWVRVCLPKPSHSGLLGPVCTNHVLIEDSISCVLCILCLSMSSFPMLHSAKYFDYLPQSRRICFWCSLFICLLVCLFVCLPVSRVVQNLPKPMSMKLGGRVWCGPKKIRFKFGECRGSSMKFVWLLLTMWDMPFANGGSLRSSMPYILKSIRWQ